MASVKKNLYQPGRNLDNLTQNVDINRFGDDKTFVEVDNSTSPATISIKRGSIIEVNGDVYTVEDSDYVFQASSTTHGFIGFDGISFTSQAAIGTLNPLKQGYYQVDNITRTLKWMIDPVSELVNKITLFSAEKPSDSTGMNEGAVMGFTIDYTVPGGGVVGLRSSGARFQAPKEGLYSFHVRQSFSNTAITPGLSWGLRVGLRFEPNGVNVLVSSSEFAGGTGPGGPFLAILDHDIYLLKGEEVEVQTVNIDKGSDIIRLAHDPPIYESGIFYGNEIIGESLK